MIESGIPDLPALSPLLSKCFEEAGVSKRLSVDECLNWVHSSLEKGITHLYIDSLDSPGALVYLSKGVSFFPRENPLTVLLVYALPERRNMEVFKDMKRTIEGFASLKGFNTVYVSEWCYGDTPGIGLLWEALGYKKQETIYVKHL